MARIHPTAVVDPGAKLAEDVEIGPYTVVGNGVELGPAVRLGPHVVVAGRTTVGARSQIYPFSVIGEEPQVRGLAAGETALRIGADNVIREHASIHAGTPDGGGCTRIGDGNFILNGVHIAHDCQVGSQTLIASFCGLAGHVVVEDHAALGAMVGVHQFCRIGESSFTGGASKLRKDVPPFARVMGQPVRYGGVNTVGLARREFRPEQISELHHAFHLLFQSGLLLTLALERVRAECGGSREVRHLLEFIESSERGVIR